MISSEFVINFYIVISIGGFFIRSWGGGGGGGLLLPNKWPSIQNFQPNMSHKMLSFWDFTLFWYYFSIVALFSVMEPKDQAIPITLCKSRNISLWIPLPSFSKSLIWVVGVEMSKKRLSTFYMLQNLEGEPLPGLPCYMFGRAECFRRWPKLLQEKLHWPHLNGFSLECLRMCIFREPAWVQEW